LITVHHVHAGQTSDPSLADGLGFDDFAYFDFLIGRVLGGVLDVWFAGFVCASLRGCGMDGWMDGRIWDEWVDRQMLRWKREHCGR
jgi:hypothetical protein